MPMPQVFGADAWDEVKTAFDFYQLATPSRGGRPRPLIEKHLNRAGSYYEDQCRQDVGMWYGAARSDTPGLLKRLWTTIYYGGLLVYRKHGYVPWAYAKVPIAVALSHGGRILIQLPKSTGNDDEFFNWLVANAEVKSRGGGTHSVKSISNPQRNDLGFGRTLYFDELGGIKKGFGGSVHIPFIQKGGKHLGYNIALGGIGEKNPWTGELIRPDGSHGHLYLYYSAPSRSEFGAMLVGCEGSQPPDWAVTGARQGGRGMLGTAQAIITGKYAYDQAGGKHTFGASGDFSPTGGLKFKDKLSSGELSDETIQKAIKKMAEKRKKDPEFISAKATMAVPKETWHNCGPSKDRGGLVVDLIGGGSMQMVMNQGSLDIDLLGSYGEAPPIVGSGPFIRPRM